ncbi:MAG: zinc ribbon domain-containing protein [Deltaproteobacteria bacterium]|nr:zinc ribbon domain-containing protein [Deltaproteobacteria bacterium]
MICPSCDRDNDGRRRYCGKCGFNFEPVCRRCNFTNEGDDRFCGGCGCLLIAKEGCHVRRGAPPPAPHKDAPDDDVAVVVAEGSAPVRAGTPPRGSAVPVPVSVGPALANELAGLFTPTVLPGKAGPLPDAGIEQADLDKLFGGTS